jgi:hypothetical protein
MNEQKRRKLVEMLLMKIDKTASKLKAAADPLSPEYEELQREMDQVKDAVVRAHEEILNKKKPH